MTKMVMMLKSPSLRTSYPSKECPVDSLWCLICLLISLHFIPSTHVTSYEFNQMVQCETRVDFWRFIETILEACGSTWIPHALTNHDFPGVWGTALTRHYGKRVCAQKEQAEVTMLRAQKNWIDDRPPGGWDTRDELRPEWPDMSTSPVLAPRAAGLMACWRSMDSSRRAGIVGAVSTAAGAYAWGGAWYCSVAVHSG